MSGCRGCGGRTGGRRSSAFLRSQKRRSSPPTANHPAAWCGPAERGAGGVCGGPARRAAVTWAPRQPGAGGWAPRGWGRGLRLSWEALAGRKRPRRWLRRRQLAEARCGSGCARGPRGLSGSHRTIQASPAGWRGSLHVGPTDARPGLPWARALGTRGPNADSLLPRPGYMVFGQVARGFDCPCSAPSGDSTPGWILLEGSIGRGCVCLSPARPGHSIVVGPVPSLTKPGVFCPEQHPVSTPTLRGKRRLPRGLR